LDPDKKIRPFTFTKQERSGIYFLLLIIALLQIGYYVYKSYDHQQGVQSIAIDKVGQTEIIALKKKALQNDSAGIYPFNPNYITDYKGYILGMSVPEIDRLHAFRAKDLYVNSAEEFQVVTQIPDSLLVILTPYFKFPDWTKNSRSISKSGPMEPLSRSEVAKGKEALSQIKDLNQASADDLKSVSGIGEKLSERIIKFRDRLGGFLVDEQLYDVYGLDPEVVRRALDRFKVLEIPKIEKININTASAQEIAQLVYIQRAVAQRIVNYRNVNGSIGSFDELTNIEDFPAEKIHRIRLYLSL
jgi:DNA uptake protein ComE-like DNA-binding protein